MTSSDPHQEPTPPANGDTTEHKAAAEKLRASEERFRLMADSAPVMVWISGVDKLCTWFNRPWLMFTGRSVEQELGNGWTEGVHPEDLSRCLKTYATAFDARKPFTMEYRLRRHDGAWSWIHDNGVPLYGPAGEFSGYIGTCIDITDRRRVEEELQESVRRERQRAEELVAILDAVPTPIFIAHDPYCLHITGNRAADELLRNPRGGEASLDAPKETRPRHFKAVKDGRELENNELPAQQAARGIRVQDFEFGLAFDDGTVRDMLSYATPLRDDDGHLRGAVNVLVDITSRKQAEVALSQSEERYRTLFSTMIEGFCIIEVIFDARARPVDYRFLEVNPAFEKQTGLRDAQGKLMRELAPDHESHWFEIYGQIALTGKPARFVNQAKALKRWYDVSAFRLGGADSRKVAILFNDITEMKNAQDALRDREARLAVILETAADGIITMDPQGVILSVNTAVSRLFGYSAEELLGHNVKLLMPHPFGRRQGGNPLSDQRTGLDRLIGIRFEVVARRKDGTTFPVELAVSKFQVEGIRTFVGMLHDVSERRRLEGEILQISEGEQARIGRDLHDGTCQELAAAAMGLDAVAQGVKRKTPAETAAAIGRMASEIRRIIARTRELSHGLYPIQLKQGGLPVALEELAKTVSAHGGLSCICQCDDSLHIADQAAVHLYRIAQEAVNNAVRHAKAGKIEICLMRERSTGNAESHINVLLRITDDGIGLPKRPPKGSGIGLQTMRHRASVIGATMEVGRRDGGGTVVTLSLPEQFNGAEECPPQISTTHRAAKARTGRRLRTRPY